MTPEGLFNQMQQNFRCWDFSFYTNKDRLKPVLMYSLIKNQAGKQRIKLEYYKDFVCNPSTCVLTEYLDTNLSDKKLVSIIDARMRSDKWFEIAEYFTGEKISSLELPVGCINVKKWINRSAQTFSVASAGYGAVYQNSARRSVSTETVFDVCVPVEWLEADVWYEFGFQSNRERKLILECIDKDHVWYEDFFESDSANKARWRGFDKYNGSEASLVLTGALGNWSFGVSAYNSRSDPQLRDSYEVRYAPDGNGFLFRVRRREVERIWFKAAWLKSRGTDQSLCQQALRHWLE